MPNTDTNMIPSELLERIEDKIKRLHSMLPLPADVVRNLNEETVLMHTYHSNAIEGNRLTLTETQDILAKGVTIEERTLQEHLEVTNTAKGFELTETLAQTDAPINHATIQQIHEVVAKGITDDAGVYRRANIKAIGSVKASPNWTEVTKLMNQLLRNVQNSRLHPIETAAFLHQQFVEIHPFPDGNGQVARLLTNLYLLERDYPAVLIKKEDRKNYNQYLKLAHSGNLTPFSDFITKAVDESLTTSLSAYGGDDELMPLEDIAEMTPYSQEYLSLRARQGVLDAVKMGKTWHTSRRAVERYFALHEEGDV